MIKSVANLNERLIQVEEDIINLKGETPLEKYTNNKWLKQIVDELTIISDELKEILLDKYREIVPEDENPVIRDLFDQSEYYRSIMKMLGKDSDFVERFGFDRTIYEVGNGKNVDALNETLKNFILDMDSIGIELNYDNFNYSVFTTKYMKVFFENLDSENYRVIMKKCFVNIYWECPELLTHLELCVRCLVYNNKNMIVRHLNHLLTTNLKNSSTNIVDLIPLYCRTKKKFYDYREADFYHIYSYFRNNRKEINKYIDTNYFYDTLGKYVDINKFNSYSKDDRKFFMSNIRELYYDLTEFKMITRFKGIFYYFITLLKDVDPDAEIKYKIARKDANKYEADKTRIDKRLASVIKRRELLSEKHKEKINKYNEQIKNLSVQVSEQIAAIKNEVDLIADLRFLIDFKGEISETSTLYEVVYFASKYYGKLTKIVDACNLTSESKIEAFVDEFRHIQYDPNLTIMKNVAFTNIEDVKELIEKKYRMHDINITIFEDDILLDGLLEDLRYLMRYENIEILDVTPDDIKILLEVGEKLKVDY